MALVQYETRNTAEVDYRRTTSQSTILPSVLRSFRQGGLKRHKQIAKWVMLLPVGMVNHSSNKSRQREGQNIDKGRSFMFQVT
jgi:hypothetical protein